MFGKWASPGNGSDTAPGPVPDVNPPADHPALDRRGSDGCGAVEVRVGIVSFNTAAHLDRCLAALPAALSGHRAEVTVVDNASADDSVDVARRHPGVAVISNPANVGYARAMNQALRGSAAPILVALNPDAVPAPGCLATLIRTIRSSPTVGLAVPRLLNPAGALEHSVFRFPSVALALVTGLVPPPLRSAGLARRWWLAGHAPHNEPATVDWAVGALHAIRAAALSDAGRPYTERAFMYGEDIDLCWSMRARGWEVRLEPGAECRHAGGASATLTWGPVEREARVLAATYEWYVAARGAWAARGFAAANLLGTSVKLPIFLARGDAYGARLARTLLRIHARRLRGPSAPPLPGP